MTYINLKQSLFNSIGECPMPPIDTRYQILKLVYDYKELVNTLENMKTVTIGQARNMVNECDHIETTLDDTFKRLVGRGMIGHSICRLIELGEYSFIKCGLDYEPEHFDEEEEEEEAPCEICGKDRKGFTENLCEECFDNETDKHYDGGLDEDD